MRFNNQLIDLPNLYHAMDQCPLTISPDTYVVDAIILMNQERSINYSPTDSNQLVNNREICRSNTCILVVEGGHLLGIFTTKDVLRVTANRINVSEVKIAEVMVQPVITLTPSNSQDIFTALSLLRQHQIRHLPILDQQGQLLGLVTETTLLKTIDKINGVNLVEICPLTGESTNQPSDPIGCQTHTYLKKWLDAQTAELMAINEELQLTLEELQMVEEELRQQNEELGVAREIAELERERYQDLFNFAPHGYLVSDATGVIQEANHAAATLLGVKQNHLVGKPLILFIAEQERQNFIIQLQTLDRVDDWEIHLQPRNGRPFPASVKAAAIYNSQGQRMGWRWLLCDITPRKQVEAKLCQASEELEIRVLERTNELSTANQLLHMEITERQRVEESLRQSEKLYRQLVETQTDLIIRLDLQGRVTFANTVVSQALGQPLANLLGESMFQFFHPDDLPKFLENIMHLISPPHCFITEEQRLLTVNGMRWVQWNATAIKNQKGEIVELQAVGRDITERKQIEDSLREGEARLSLALEAAEMGIWDWDFLTNQIVCSPNMALMYGLPGSVDSETIEDFFKLIHPEDGEYLSGVIARSIEETNEYKCEFRIVWPDGSIHWLREKGKVFFNELGQPIRLIGTTKRIDEPKQAQEKIRQQAALLDIATDAILVIDFESTILFWNKGAERIYGWQAQEAVGKKPEDLFYKKTSPQLKAALKTALQTLTESGSWQGELTRFTQSGQEIIVESRWTLMYDPAGQPTSILSVDTDVTEKKQLEDQFLRAQRLESLGTLAGGIAHDLNNILTPILAASQLLQMKCPQNKEHYHNLLAIIESNTKRGAALVKQVLSFARGFRGEPTIVQLKHIITEITQIAQQTFPKSIKFAITIPKDLWAVLGDATQLHQVLMNLVVNARDAMPTGGMVTISAKNMLIDEAYARMNLDAQVGYYVVMTVADTGMGIPPEILDKIFDPFFTTKPVGKGTGLGLSTVLGIIKSHGGFINVSSIVQQGSKFELFLPAVEVTQSLEINNLEIFPGNGELILFVDDEAEIREIAKIVLEKHNYRILTASNGIEAIALYAQYKQDISVVLMDIMMPEMDGITAIRTLQKMNQQVLIIACSGINSQEALANANITLVLSKPYTTPDLLYSLHHILTNRMGLEAPPSRTAF